MSTLLEVQNLKKYFKFKHGWLQAVDGISFKLEKGKTLGVVGESGCGKSTLGRTILHLLNKTEGEIIFDGENISQPSASKLKEFRENAQIIFQDPYSSLDPRKTVSKIIMEPLALTKRMSKPEMTKRVAEIMETVGLASRFANSYPHELDGGRRQRIGVARALALDPKFIVCDEPVSALDVSVQAQILNLLMDLQQDRGLTYIFVTHDLSVVKHISDEILVMYLGKMIEKAETEELFENPLHPYTKALLSAILVPDVHAKKDHIILEGEIKSPINLGDECRFAPRCIYAKEECKQAQKLEEIKPGHFISCCRARELNNL